MTINDRITNAQYAKIHILVDSLARVDDGLKTVCLDEAISLLTNIKHTRENLPF